MSTHLGVVTILVGDMSRTKAFYTELLGFEVVQPFSSPSGDFIFLHSKTGNVDISLQDAAKRGRKPTLAKIPEESGGMQLGFEVEDADAAYRGWQSKSVEIRTEVVDMGQGRTFGAKDPDGNYLQIYDIYPQAREIQKQLLGLG